MSEKSEFSLKRKASRTFEKGDRNTILTKQSPKSHFKVTDLKAFDIIFDSIEKQFTQKIIKFIGILNNYY